MSLFQTDTLSTHSVSFSFRKIPAFGSTIRHFLGNASEMKKLAARDFEDLLQVRCNVTFAFHYCKLIFQCSIPAFEHLFEREHNQRLMKLLFRLAQWHALAKLRLHTDPTLEWLEKTTVEVGKLMREFRDKSAAKFATFELPREQDARARRQAAAQSRQTSGSKQMPKKCMLLCSFVLRITYWKYLTATSTNVPPSKKARTLNLFTYKWHAMGDYVSTIRWFGTTDNYSTQVVSIRAFLDSALLNTYNIKGELAHRTVKMLYGLTNKRDATKQIAK